MNKNYKLPGNEKIIKHPTLVSGNSMVTVCVQTYNHGNFIEQCLNGILSQKTTFPFEILLGEDGSTDNTRAICLEYANRYPDKIRLFLHDRSNVIKIGGKPTGRYNFIYNLGNVNSKYVALLDGDDYWTDVNKLQKQFEFLENNKDISICFTNYSVINGEIKKENFVPIKFQKELNQFNLFTQFSITPLTCVFRRDCLPTHLPNSFTKVLNADCFLYAYLTRNHNASYIDINSGYYRMHSGGIWSGLNDIDQKYNYLRTRCIVFKENIINDRNDVEPFLIEKAITLIKCIKNTNIPLYSKIYHLCKVLFGLQFIYKINFIKEFTSGLRKYYHNYKNRNQIINHL